MKYKVGDKLICIKDINNFFGWPLFEKDKIYEILRIDINDGEMILNHVLYANEFGEFSEEYVNKNFISVKELRKKKIESVNAKKAMFK